MMSPCPGVVPTLSRTACRTLSHCPPPYRAGHGDRAAHGQVAGLGVEAEERHSPWGWRIGVRLCTLAAHPATTRQAPMTGSGTSISLGRTNAAILSGEEDLTLWSEEELIRGQKKGKNGRWTGRKPKVVPTAVHHELTRRRMGQAYELMREDLVAAVQVLGDIVKDTEASNRDRLRAAELIMDRVLGKATERVEVKLAPEPWEQLLVGSVVDLPIETTAVEDG